MELRTVLAHSPPFTLLELHPQRYLSPEERGSVLSLSGQGLCLNMAGVSWGFFEGDFNLSVTNASPNHFRSASRHLHRGAQRHGPRLPLLVISPWANKNYVDSTPTDQASIIRFIEDTFLSSARIGGGSFDATAGTLNNMFNFTNGATAPNPNVVLPNPTTGTVTTGN